MPTEAQQGAARTPKEGKQDMDANFSFPSGLPDCCSANPDFYKVLCDIPKVGRMVEMKIPPGASDLPHDHPSHPMYVVSDNNKIQVTPFSKEGQAIEGGTHVIDVTSGAAPIFPAGPHQVKNVGEGILHIVFLEPYALCQPCGDPDVDKFLSPFVIVKQCYNIVAQNDMWITGVLTMKANEKDPPHHHRNHFIYVLEGEEGKAELEVQECHPKTAADIGEAAHVPIKKGMGIPAPMTEGLFTSHRLRNSGSCDFKLLIFEQKC